MIKFLRKLNTLKHSGWYLKEQNRLRKFHDLHKDQDCIIIGNGPSLNKMDLSVLKDYHTFGLNKIYLMKNRGIDLNLSYLVSVNKFVIEQSEQQYLEMNHPVFLSYKNRIESFKENKNIHYVLSYGEKDFSTKVTQPLNEGGTVTYVALQLAYYMGFKRVHLIGVDHSFKQEGKPNEKQKMETEDANHFDPNYFKGQTWQLADLDRSEQSYLMARQAFEKNGRAVLDATLNGKLQIFPKVNFEEALKTMKKK